MVLVSPSSDGGEAIADGTKKKKLTNHLEKSDGRRLVEYLVVVSSLERKSLSDEGKGGEKEPANDEQYRLSTEIDDDDIELGDHEGFKPSVTTRYPPYDHEDNPFDANVSYFCHISGAIRLKKQPFMPKVRNECYLFVQRTYNYDIDLSFGCDTLISHPTLLSCFSISCIRHFYFSNVLHGTNTMRSIYLVFPN
jgi:hypothetical protein